MLIPAKSIFPKDKSKSLVAINLSVPAPKSILTTAPAAVVPPNVIVSLPSPATITTSPAIVAEPEIETTLSPAPKVKFNTPSSNELAEPIVNVSTPVPPV